MSCTPAASFVVRRTFLDLQPQRATRPRANSDAGIRYSFAEDLDSKCGKCDSLDTFSTSASTLEDEGSVGSADVADGLSWSAEMEQEADFQEAGWAADAAAAAWWLSSSESFEPTSMTMEAMPMLYQQAPYFMMMPIAAAAQPMEAMAVEQTQEAELLVEQTQNTTLVLRKLPKDLSSIQFRRMLDSAEFEGLYDFVYVPMNFKSSRNLGYALVNFTEPRHALAAQECFHGARMGQGALVAEFSSKHSVLSSLIEQYRGSHVLTDAGVPEEHKPQLLQDGKAIPFPGAAPTADGAEEGE